jgi:predicted HAD superfamily Cof-like phosphohydrolase
MHEAQRLVKQYHRAMGIPEWLGPSIRKSELRITLIEEEAREAVEAIRAGDLLHSIKELCDIIVVTYGAAEQFSVDLEPFFAEVHKSNLAKTGGPVRADGKHLKPEGWEPPDLVSVFVSQFGEEALAKELRRPI